MFVPAAAADSDEALALRVTAEPSEAGKRLRLEVGTGSAIITLTDPVRRSAEFGGFGRCTLEAVDRARGAAFVEALARWLHASAPAAGVQNPLEPVPCSFALLGGGRDPSGQAWEVRKLFLRSARDDAEVYLRLSPDGRRAELLEKDEDYRAPLLDALAIALRDGPTPRRAAATDPNLASDAPIFDALKPIAGLSASPSATAWAGSRLLAAVKEGKGAVVWSWSKLDEAPRELARFDGHVEVLEVDPTAARVAVRLLHPQREGSISSEDPGEVVLVDLATGRSATVAKSTQDIEVGMGSEVVWSPRVDAVAIGVRSKAGDGGRSECTLEYDTQTGAERARSDVDAHPVAWNDRGVVLERFERSAALRDARKTVLDWRPGQGAPTERGGDPLAKETSTMRSPDGRWRLRVEGGALVVEGKGDKARRFESARDREALEALAESAPTWLGPNRLVFESDDAVLLDLETLKLRLLFPKGEYRLTSARPDGRVALIRKDDVLYWAEVE